MLGCASSRSQTQHEGTLVNIHKHYGTVVSSDQVVAAWQKLGTRVAPRG